jgi:hypothetical protein
MMNNQHMNSAQPRNSRNRKRQSSKVGRYLKDVPVPSHRRRRRRRKLNPRFIALMAVLLAMLIGIALGIRSCSKPKLTGRWNIDGTTVYEFGKNGKGALILMTARYEFHYEIDGDTLKIDFIDDAALDAKYTFEVDKKVLFMTGGPGDARSEYVLNKID